MLPDGVPWGDHVVGHVRRGKKILQVRERVRPCALVSDPDEYLASFGYNQ